MVLLVAGKERPPRFAVFADDLLGDGAAEDAFVLAFEAAGVGISDAFVVFEEGLAASVVRLVSETRRSVQPANEHLTLFLGAGANVELVGSLHHRSIRSFGS